MDQNGKLLPEGRICWSEAPTEVVIRKPYAVALLPRFVEVTECLKMDYWLFLVVKGVENILMHLIASIAICRYDHSEIHIR